jgi:hypothetical protein
MIKDEFKLRCDTPSDINEHLVALSELSKECNHITEMGVRYIVSTWAFLEGLKGRNGKLVSIDIEPPSRFGGNLTQVMDMAEEEGVDFEFRLADTLQIEIDETDLLFIDTLHEYAQLKEELKLHADKARKYIAFHDSVSCESELMPAINEFLSEGKWKIKEHFTHNNGVLILERC